MVQRSLLDQCYVLLRKLADGGMGEVFLARQTGVGGFERLVVFKRIHRRLSEHPRAVRMFLDEARLAMALCHPNIVQIYDVGDEHGCYFMVMERIQGANVRELAETRTRQGLMIPLELSLTIIAQVLEGLQYAHSYRDPTGRPMHIVHRDICPTNILISHDGAVKIVDFGIARAGGMLREESLPAGKFPYMSPEVVRGDPADGRSDLFSLGVLLYELTVGQRLFRAASFETMKRAIEEPIPPPTFARASYPAELEMIVMRALERDPADRYQSAAEMLDELESYAFKSGLRLSRLRLGRFVCEVMGVNRQEGGGLEASAEEEVAPAGASHDELDFDARGPSAGVQRSAGAPPQSTFQQGSTVMLTDDLVESVAVVNGAAKVEEPPMPPPEDPEDDEEEGVPSPLSASEDLRQALADITGDLNAADARERVRRATASIPEVRGPEPAAQPQVLAPVASLCIEPDEEGFRADKLAPAAVPLSAAKALPKEKLDGDGDDDGDDDEGLDDHTVEMKAYAASLAAAIRPEDEPSDDDDESLDDPTVQDDASSRAAMLGVVLRGNTEEPVDSEGAPSEERTVSTPGDKLSR